MARKLGTPEDKLKHLYLSQGRSITQCAKVFGCSKSHIHRWLKRYEIPIRTTRNAWYERCDYKNGFLELSKENLIAHYVKNKLTLKETGEIFGCSDTTIRNHLVRFDIERRSISDALGGIKRSDEFRSNLSKIRIGINHTDETKLKFSGEKHWNWKGGISREPYCDVWLDKEFKNSIKERDNEECQNPDCWGSSDKLCVHHIDYDKKNCDPNNLITLCNSCNIRSNKNKHLWKTMYELMLTPLKRLSNKHLT